MKLLRQTQPRASRSLTKGLSQPLAAVALSLLIAPLAQAQTSISRLSSLLDTIPQYGWVKVNTNNFSDAWPTGSTAVDVPGQPNAYSSPSAIIHAWSSVAWDSARGDLLLWGGGHANYAGNEMYVWNGSSGQWTRGSLPSQVDNTANRYIVDNAAPQAAHTYDNNLYLPVNDMFLTFGGAAFPTGGPLQSASGTTGPWLWDPTKADPNKVGGTTGSGYDPNTVGGNMWINRKDSLSGPQLSGAPFTNGTTAYRTENGKDVVYVTVDPFNSGFPTLYRYTFGDVRNGGTDTWERIGESMNSVGFKGAATIDSKRNLYIRTASNFTTYHTWTSELEAWSIDPSIHSVRYDIPIELVNLDGTPFQMTGDFGLDYDSVDDKIFLWDGKDRGTVWYVTPDSNSSTWVVHKLFSSTTAQPDGNFQTGVLGKWDYIAELNAFVALDEYSDTDPGGVWLFKPFASADQTSLISEPQTLSMLLAGMVMVSGFLARRGKKVA